VETTRFQEMAAILPIRFQQIGEQNVFTVEVRHIQHSLGSKVETTTFAKRQNERAGLIEDRDFIFFDIYVKKSRGRPHIEYHYTLDAAKKICMMSETKMGNEVREYFLECERRVQALASAPLQPQTFDTFKLDVHQVINGNPCDIHLEGPVWTARSPKPSDQVLAYDFLTQQAAALALAAQFVVNSAEGQPAAPAQEAEAAPVEQSHKKKTKKSKKVDNSIDPRQMAMFPLV